MLRDWPLLTGSQNLKSAEEMEEEEKSAQSAKLQELIRRGGPEDLQEANRLMKVMAGYDTRHKTDYRAKAAEEVSKVQQKAKILEEMLQDQKEGDKLTEGDVFEVKIKPLLSSAPADCLQELANALQSAHPKIQRMCEEESDDAEAVAKLLEINDSIHRTIERYKLIKKGELAAANQIPKGTLGTSTGVGKNADNELSLIDFDPEPTSTSNGANEVAVSAEQKTASLEDDLLGLSFQDKPFGQAGGIALGFGTNSGTGDRRVSLYKSCLRTDIYRSAWTRPLIINHAAEFRENTSTCNITSTPADTSSAQIKLRCFSTPRRLPTLIQTSYARAGYSPAKAAGSTLS